MELRSFGYKKKSLRHVEFNNGHSQQSSTESGTHNIRVQEMVLTTVWYTIGYSYQLSTSMGSHDIWLHERVLMPSLLTPVWYRNKHSDYVEYKNQHSDQSSSIMSTEYSVYSEQWVQRVPVSTVSTVSTVQWGQWVPVSIVSTVSTVSTQWGSQCTHSTLRTLC